MSLSAITKNALIESSMSYMLDKYIRPNGGESITLDDLKGDEELSKLYDQFFKKETKKTKKAQKSDKPKKEQQQPKVSLEDRASADIDHSKCMCRIWNKEHLDNIQCSSKKANGDYCNMHAKKIEEHGPWWCGLITEKRPEELIGPSTKPKDKQTRHYWKDQLESKPKKKSIPKKKSDTPKKKSDTPKKKSATPKKTVENVVPEPVENIVPTPVVDITNVSEEDLDTDENIYDNSNGDGNDNSNDNDDLDSVISDSEEEGDSL